jgi:hypothetical protein
MVDGGLERQRWGRTLPFRFWVVSNGPQMDDDLTKRTTPPAPRSHCGIIVRKAPAARYS